MKQQKTRVAKLEMNHEHGEHNDINLYICDEKNLYTRAHTHTFFEVMLVIKGKLAHEVNDKEQLLSENDICILRPEAKHAVKRLENTPFLLYNFEVNIQYLHTLCNALGFVSADDIFDAPASYTHCTATEALEYMNILTIPSKITDMMLSSVAQTSLKIIVTKILAGFILHLSRGLQHKKEDSVLSTMLGLLEDKNNFHLTIKALCEQTFYTQEHITRLFKKANLDSPNHIHLQKKLQYAAHLLLNSDIKIINIAEACGIDTLSYFTKTFKREYGLSPSAYKKKYRKK